MKKGETLGQRMKRLRQSAHFTQQKLATEAGVAVSNIRNWEQDHRTPSVYALFRIARTLGRKMEDFLEEMPEVPTRTNRKPGRRNQTATA